MANRTIIGELLYNLGFDVDRRSVNEADRSVERITERFDNLRNTILGLAGSYFAIAGLSDMVNTFVQDRTELGRWANVIGTTRNELEDLAGAFPLTEMQDFASVVADLNQVTEEALEGDNGAIEKFERLGIAFEEFAGLDTEQRILRVAKALEGLNADQVTLASTLVGEEDAYRIFFANLQGTTQETLDLARQRFRALRGEVQQSGDDMANRYKLVTREMGFAFQGIQYEIAQGLLPIINNVIGAFTEWWFINGRLFRQDLAEFFSVLQKSLGFLTETVKELLSPIDDVVQVMGGWSNVISALIYGVGGSLLLKLIKAVRNLGLAFLIKGFLRINAIAGGLLLIGGAIQDVVKWIEGAPSLLGDFFGPFEEFRQNHPNIVKAFNVLKEAVISLGNFAMDLGGSLTNFLGSFVRFIVSSTEKLLGFLSTIGDYIPDWLKSWLSGSKNIAIGAVNELGLDKIPETISSAASGLDEITRVGLQRDRYINPPIDRATTNNDNSTTTNNITVNNTGSDAYIREMIRETTRENSVFNNLSAIGSDRVF